jgi:drug/metabolite transporter (DMT)-like permease
MTVAAGAPVVTPAALIAGILWALAAGAAWGLAFIAAPGLPGWSAVEIAAGRYVAYGLFAAVVLVISRRGSAVAGLREPQVWWTAFGLSLVGNLLYFVLVTAGIQRAGGPIAALIIGTLPVLLPVAANLRERTTPVSRLLVPCLLMLAGIAAVHLGEHGRAATSQAAGVDYWVGIALIVAALLSWTWYGVANAVTLQRRPDVSAATWASLQGVTLLPVVLPILAWTLVMVPAAPGRASLATFLAISAILGIVTSWLAMWCWNRASQLLPAAIAGQLIVFETLAALVYAFAWKWTWPPALVVMGTALLVSGVVIGVRALGR